MLFFYSLPNIEITHFMNSLLPKLKHSLSLTLQHYYPLAGNLIWCPQLNQPVLRYVHGDSVELVVAESNANFDHLSSKNRTRYANDFQHLLPQLTVPSPNSSNAVPLLALQLTLFQNSGICIGLSQPHATGDGRSVAMFLKSWSLNSKFLGISTSFLLYDHQSLLIIPFFDRTVLKNVSIRFQEAYFLHLVKFIRSKYSMSEQDCMNWLLASMEDLKVPPNHIAASFELTGTDIGRLRKWVTSRTNTSPSRFVLVFAYIWVCLAKATNVKTTRDDPKEGLMKASSVLSFADYRARLDPPLPPTYFGNCVGEIVLSTKKGDLVGEDGLVVAVNLIVKEIRGLDDTLVRDVDPGLANLMFPTGDVSEFDVIAGSTQFGFYELDFGLGRPKKVELASIAKTRAIFFADSRNGDGVEISLVRCKDEIDAFGLSFVNGLNDLSVMDLGRKSRL
ncbi:hypothetical protein Scep_009259 [Stephania cephalantha]|uniref:Uncharacterized protein n=1 Tax=Stephania cephalantha TaxID=152367 RepID=A0AAP0JU86_9MAGN